MKHNVKLVSLGSGLAMGYLGNSHYGTEDIAVTRCIPNVEILSPADAIELVEIMSYAATNHGPMFIRITGIPGLSTFYDEIRRSQVIGCDEIVVGKDVSILATGTMVRVALETAEFLEQFNVRPSVINVNRIKPLNEDFIIKHLEANTHFITIEEHSTLGGLGSALDELLMRAGLFRNHLAIGLQDSYDITSDYISLLKHHGLTAQDVGEKILAFLN